MTWKSFDSDLSNPGKSTLASTKYFVDPLVSPGLYYWMSRLRTFYQIPRRVLLRSLSSVKEKFQDSSPAETSFWCSMISFSLKWCFVDIFGCLFTFPFAVLMSNPVSVVTKAENQTELIYFEQYLKVSHHCCLMFHLDIFFKFCCYCACNFISCQKRLPILEKTFEKCE